MSRQIMSNEKDTASLCTPALGCEVALSKLPLTLGARAGEANSVVLRGLSITGKRENSNDKVI